MRRLLLLALLLCTAVVSPAANNASMNGKWKIQNSIAGNQSQLVCTFTQMNNDLGGSCTTEQGNFNVSGRVDDKKITWSYDSKYHGFSLTVIYSGTLEAVAKASGNVSIQRFGVTGSFIAVRSE